MDKEKDQDSPDEPSIANELARFITHVDSLAETIDPMLFAIHRIVKKIAGIL